VGDGRLTAVGTSPDATFITHFLPTTKFFVVLESASPDAPRISVGQEPDPPKSAEIDYQTLEGASPDALKNSP
jgi:hypothetical protein